MKKVLSVAAVAGLVAVSSAAFAGSIVNSKHNLSKTGTGTNITPGTSTQICVYCHAPHNARFQLPLWNRADSTVTFKLYSGINMQNTSFKSGFTADSTSLFCMSCHDGSTTMSAVHNAGVLEGQTAAAGQLNHAPIAGRFSGDALTGPATLGAQTADSLTKTHPINFPVSLTDGQSDLNLGSASHMGPGQSALGAAYTFGATFPLFKTTDARGGANNTRMLECGSCHAVHDSTFSPFLRDTMNGSQLCLGCHNK